MIYGTCTRGRGSSGSGCFDGGAELTVMIVSYPFVSFYGQYCVMSTGDPSKLGETLSVVRTGVR